MTENRMRVFEALLDYLVNAKIINKLDFLDAITKYKKSVKNIEEIIEEAAIHMKSCTLNYSWSDMSKFNKNGFDILYQYAPKSIKVVLESGGQPLLNIFSEKFAKSITSNFKDVLGKFIIIAELGKDEAKKYVGTASSKDIPEILQELLMDEYLQQALYQNYKYLLFGADGISLMEHLEEHLKDEMRHADILQRYIVSLNHVPTTERHVIPNVEKGNIKELLALNLKHEKAAVNKYSVAIKVIEEMNNVLHAALLNDLEDIASDEQEHTHDLERWLK